MPFQDRSVWGTASDLHQRIFAKAANGGTCGSYFADGRWNLGGWWTYPSADARALGGGTSSQSSTSKENS